MQRPFSIPQPRCWIGLDGTRNGWSAAILSEDGDVDFVLIAALAQVWHIARQYDVGAIAIDMPLGLTAKAERGGRGCDREARRILARAKRQTTSRHGVSLVGPSSIFSPPSRPALLAFARGASHAEVSAANRSSASEAEPSTSRPGKRKKAEQSAEKDGQGLGLSIQLYNILPRIRELDSFATKARSDGLLDFCPEKSSSTGSVTCLFECHPELAFLSLSATRNRSDLQCTKALASKKSSIGRLGRLELLLDSALLSTENLRCLLDNRATDHIDKEDDMVQRLAAQSSWTISEMHNDGRWKGTERIKVPADDVIDSLICAHSARRCGEQSLIAIHEGNTIPNNQNGMPMVIYM